MENYSQHLTRLNKAIELLTTRFLEDDEVQRTIGEVAEYDSKYDIKIIVGDEIFNLGFHADIATQLPTLIDNINEDGPADFDMADSDPLEILQRKVDAAFIIKLRETYEYIESMLLDDESDVEGDATVFDLANHNISELIKDLQNI